MKRGLMLGVGAILVALAAGWFLFLRSDAPPPVSLDDAVATATSTTRTEADTATQEAGINGTWTVDTTNSFAGYRIGEELANVGTVEAVGRTSEIQATLAVDQSTITVVSVEVNMQTLESDRSQRDDALRGRGLETDAFPTATFELASPIDLGAEPAAGETISATATGDLTIHGVTNPVELAIEGQVVDASTVVVVGSLDIMLTDYGIEAPTGFAVLSINDIGTVELQLEFTRS